IARLDHSRTGERSATAIFFRGPAQWALGHDESCWCSLHNLVVRWRPVSMHRAMLGFDRSSRAARIREKTRDPNHSARWRIAGFIYHDAAICVVRLAGRVITVPSLL